MTIPFFDIDKLKTAVRASRYQMKHHAVLRCQQRGYTLSDIKSVILEGEMIEHSPKAHPLPKCLMMKIIDKEPLYVAVAYNADINYAYIITVHGYDPEKWDDPRTRKQ